MCMMGVERFASFRNGLRNNKIIATKPRITQITKQHIFALTSIGIDRQITLV